MSAEHVTKISQELQLRPEQVKSTAALLAEDATVPFISRYRKEATGGLDEVAITNIRDRLQQLRELDKRRETILKSLEEQGKLTDDLKKKVLSAETSTELEDIYLPYKPKRRTRATIAREKGLEPLAEKLLGQEDFDPTTEAAAFVDAEKGVENTEDALAGARDIIAEIVNENQEARERVRTLYFKKGVFRTKVVTGKEEEGVKFKDYYEWEEPVSSAPSHRVLAMRRGEKEGVLLMRIVAPDEEATDLLNGIFAKAENAAAAQVKMAVEDGYKRLLAPSMETEIRLATKKQADEEAIKVFADNLRQLLLAPPLGRKNVLALDPGFRTGCKVVCLGRQGELLHYDTIYPFTSDVKRTEAEERVKALCRQFDIEAIAIGNGTASRETEAFVRGLDIKKTIIVVMVDESGASVYSASPAAREEFPEQDVTVRGSVSIGRRLMDPLAELVKIDAKSIGVGQYQHDVDQTALKGSLDDTVISCVNAVGVEVNTASQQLLTYVSGLGPKLAQGIVTYRTENGPFSSRKQLMNVPRLGAKAFEQAAGFLRIRDADNPLDKSAVHPESYHIVERMAADLGCDVADLMQSQELRDKIDLEEYVTEEVGLPTLTDIMAELAKPGRDPRRQFEAFQFLEGVEKMEDLEPGMQLPGIITNITNFGAFCDIGVHQDGLIHISQLADRYVKHPSEVVKLRQHVTVKVLDIDLERKRIGLSMRQDAEPEPKSETAKSRSGGKRARGSQGRGSGRPRSERRDRGGSAGASSKSKSDSSSGWTLGELMKNTGKEERGRRN